MKIVSIMVDSNAILIQVEAIRLEGTANVRFSIIFAEAICFILTGSDWSNQKFFPSREIDAAVVGIILQTAPITMGRILDNIQYGKPISWQIKSIPKTRIMIPKATEKKKLKIVLVT